MTATAAATTPTTWTLDRDHTEIGFRVRHLMVSWVKGSFGRFTGTVVHDDAHPEATRIDVTIEAASIDTKQPQRDEHLRSADFLDAATHPTLAFRSTSARRSGEGLEVTGELTIRGVTRPVTLHVSDLAAPQKDPWGGTRRGATATARLSRKDFGLVWNAVVEGGGVLVGDDVSLQLEVELVAAPAAQLAA